MALFFPLFSLFLSLPLLSTPKSGLDATTIERIYKGFSKPLLYKLQDSTVDMARDSYEVDDSYARLRVGSAVTDDERTTEPLLGLGLNCRRRWVS